MILQIKLAENSYNTHNHAINSNLMFCLVINEKNQIISVDSRSKIKDYKIADTVLFLVEEQIH